MCECAFKLAQNLRVICKRFLDICAAMEEMHEKVSSVRFECFLLASFGVHMFFAH